MQLMLHITNYSSICVNVSVLGLQDSLSLFIFKLFVAINLTMYTILYSLQIATYLDEY